MALTLEDEMHLKLGKGMTAWLVSRYTSFQGQKIMPAMPSFYTFADRSAIPLHSGVSSLENLGARPMARVHSCWWLDQGQRPWSGSDSETKTLKNIVAYAIIGIVN